MQSIIVSTRVSPVAAAAPLTHTAGMSAAMAAVLGGLNALASVSTLTKQFDALAEAHAPWHTTTSASTQQQRGSDAAPKAAAAEYSTLAEYIAAHHDELFGADCPVYTAAETAEATRQIRAWFAEQEARERATAAAAAQQAVVNQQQHMQWQPWQQPEAREWHVAAPQHVQFELDYDPYWCPAFEYPTQSIFPTQQQQQRQYQPQWQQQPAQLFESGFQAKVDQEQHTQQPWQQPEAPEWHVAAPQRVFVRSYYEGPELEYPTQSIFPKRQPWWQPELLESGPVFAKPAPAVVVAAPVQPSWQQQPRERSASPAVAFVVPQQQPKAASSTVQYDDDDEEEPIPVLRIESVPLASLKPSKCRELLTQAKRWIRYHTKRSSSSSSSATAPMPLAASKKVVDFGSDRTLVGTECPVSKAKSSSSSPSRWGAIKRQCAAVVRPAAVLA
ncbi:hypothetical protein H9P43_006541 [Blastocladiella emersonii ATCC 22665]|nr:hypothetical protein H9P43_006541 [Blastocladiella emersonii ATCC 22665]